LVQPYLPRQSGYKSLDIEPIYWRLLQKRVVHTNFNIYVVILIIIIINIVNIITIILMKIDWWFGLVMLFNATQFGRDRMVVGLTTALMQSVPIFTNVMSSNSILGEVYSIQHYVINFVSYFWQVGCFFFLWVLWFPPSIKLTTTI
jgi:hypothetical protein